MKKKFAILVGIVAIIGFSAASARESTLTGWTVSKSNLSDYEIVCDRTNVSDGGSNSLRMYIEKSADSGYAEIRSVGIVPQKSTTYVFEFDYKSDIESGTLNSVIYAGSTSINRIVSSERTLSGGTEWQHYRTEFETQSNQAVLTVRIKLQEDMTNLWIDNIRLYVYGTEENVLSNADMNADLNVAPGAVTGVGVSDIYANDITVNWSDPTDLDLEKISVKNMLTNEVILYDKGVEQFVLTDVPRDANYKFDICAIDVDGNLSTPETIEFTTETIPFVLADPITTEADGKVTISISAVNNKITDGKRITFVAFLYEGGAIKDAQALISVLPADGIAKELKLELALPAGKILGDCTIKTYLIDRFANMQEVDDGK